MPFFAIVHFCSVVFKGNAISPHEALRSI